MDNLSLSAKSQTLTLISCAQLSTFSTSTKPLRSEFLGCAHNLRPPGGRAPRLRSKCKKLRVRGNGYQRVLIAAELDSSAVLVVVAVTFLSALSVVYLNQDPNKKEKKNKKSSESEEVLDSLGFALPQFGRSIVNDNIGSRIAGIGNFQMLVPVIQKDLVENAKINSYEAKGKEIQCQESTLLPDSSLFDKKTETLEADSFASTGNFVVSEESEVTDLSLSSPVPLMSDDVPHLVTNKNSQSTLANGRKGAVSDSEFPGPVLKTNVTIASFPVYHESGKKRDFSSYFGIFKESIREDLYTFYGVNQSVIVSLPSLNSLKVVSSHAFPVNSNKFPLLKANSVLKRAELSAEQSIDIAERKVPVAHYDGCSFKKNMKLGRGNKRRNLALESHTKLPQLPHPSGKIVKDRDHLPEQSRAYNHLLRVGRLSDCVNILEDLERRGLLDMNKLYHAKFFEICRRKKTVKEAFRFCKLIPNPTLSTFNMLMSVCASSQDSEGAFQVLRFSQDAGLKADCKLYTTLISTCAKSGRVDTMFEVFHEMVNAGVNPNVHTYGALIDGCARAGQVAKAFGAYGIMRSKNVKPDRVVFNALITACGQSGAVDRAFDVLAEMKVETQPIDPDHITVGALMKACTNAGQVDRAKEVYNMLHEYNIKGTPEVYTIAINCFSEIGDWDSARSVYDDMKMKGVIPDEVFLSALIDVAGHAGKIDVAFKILQEARIQGKQPGIITYSSLMGACSNAKNWQKALALYEDIKSIKLTPTVSTMNALITALCDGDQLPKAIEVLSQMKSYGLRPNTITYSTLLVASKKRDDLEVGLALCSQAKADCVVPTLLMCKCIIGMCLRRFEKACALGEPIFSFESDRPQLHNKWTRLALVAYREAIAAGEVPTLEVVSQLLGCLQLPCDASLKKKLIENLGVTVYSSNCSLWSLVDGFGEYDPCAFSLLEEAASFGIIQCVSFKESHIVVDAKKLPVHTAEVYLLTILKGLKHRLAAGAKIPNITIYLPFDKAQITTPDGHKTINVAGRIGQKVASLLRRLGLPYLGNESYGKIRINGISLRRWLQPKLDPPFSGKHVGLNFSQSKIRKGIIDQQRNIRTGNFSLE